MRGLRGHVAGHQTVGRTGETTVGEQRDLVAQALADQRRGDLEHLAHARAARGALVADHNNITGLDPLILNRVKRLFLGFEDSGGTLVLEPLVSGELHHAPQGREIAPQDREAAGGLQRIGQGPDDLLALGLYGRIRFFADGSPRDRNRFFIENPRLLQPLCNHTDAAGGVEIGRDEAPAGLQVREQRRAARDLVEVVKLELDAGLLSNGEQVQDTIG